MLIKDEATQAKHAALDPKFQQHLENDQRLKEYIAQCDWIDEFRPDDPERQRGKMKTRLEVENMIKALVPGELRFMVNPKNVSKCSVAKVFPDGEVRTICCYENGWMPEWSIMKPLYEWVPDSNVQVITKQMVEEQGEWAGFKQVPTMVIEWIRGWRSILITLVNEGYVSGEKVNRLYPVEKADRVNWAAKTMSQSVTPIY
jgi:hypothetical protein